MRGRLRAESAVAALFVLISNGPAEAQLVVGRHDRMPPREAFQPTYEIRDARITHYRRPPFGSGILHVYVIFHVRGPEGADYRIHWTYMGETQFLPPVGSVCRFRFHHEPGLTNPGLGDSPRDFSRPGLFADSISCDTGEAE